ncbi:hypothetical protein HYV31_02275 [candidate division WWE3 bacterium]|nr:hypothetical protein [candidate division WWE3 bacterium]
MSLLACIGGLILGYGFGRFSASVDKARNNVATDKIRHARHFFLFGWLYLTILVVVLLLNYHPIVILIVSMMAGVEFTLLYFCKRDLH